MIRGAILPDFKPLVAPLEPVFRIMLAVMGLLGLIYLYSLKDRLWPRHRIPPLLRLLPILGIAAVWPRGLLALTRGARPDFVRRLG